jgi:uncharacterized protein YggE
MPVTKNNGALKSFAEACNCSTKECSACCGGKGCCRHSFGKKIMITLVGIILAYVIVLLGTMIRNNLQKYYTIGYADKQERTIVVSGQGKVTATPDIAITNMGLVSEAATVSEAQKKNTETMNKLVEKLKVLGVADKDLQTASYNIYPQYDYTDKGSVLKGYQVSQSLEIKIRDLAKANEVLALAGEFNLNNVGGLQFTIDDKEVYKAEARKLALEKVAEKAKALSRALGVRLVAIVSYNEYGNDNAMPVYYGMGGSMAEAVKAAAPAPDIQAGSNDVTLNVDVAFEIR